MIKTKTLYVIMSIMCVLGFTAAAHAEWQFGVGTGISAMSVSGDIGANVDFPEIDPIGPVKLNVDLSPSDIMDYMDTAIGLGVFATDGNWMIQSSYAHIALEDDPSGTRGPLTIKTDLNFDLYHGDLMVGYPIYKGESTLFRAYTGFRYTKTEIDTKIAITGLKVDETLKRNIDESWTDILIGVSADVPFGESWNWNTMFDAGFGGSEGSYYVNTGINWRFAEHWSTGLGYTFYAVEYENGSEGDADWYLYDVDESTLGLKIAYVW